MDGLRKLLGGGRPMQQWLHVFAPTEQRAREVLGVDQSVPVYRSRMTLSWQQRAEYGEYAFLWLAEPIAVAQHWLKRGCGCAGCVWDGKCERAPKSEVQFPPLPWESPGVFLVRDESGRGESVGDLSASDVVERFGDDWDDATEGEHPFPECLAALEVGGELRIDGATVVVRVS